MDAFKLTHAEASTLGIGEEALVAADLARYRRLAMAAEPELSDFQWKLLSDALQGLEANSIANGEDQLPTAEEIAAHLMEWAADADYDAKEEAEKLRSEVLTWPELTIAGVTMRLRQQSSVSI